MRLLRKNTAVMVTVGPFYDKTDGVTIKTALTITNERITLTADTDDGSAPTNILDNVTGATSGTANDLNYITGNDAGMMQLELAAADTNRLGRMLLSITDAANHVPVFHEFMVVNAALYDAFFATSGGAIPNAVAGASTGLLISGSNAGTTTLGALTVTGASTLTGNVALADGLTIAAPSTANRAGLDITGNGTGAAMKLAAGATGKGIAITTTAGDGLSILPTAGDAIVAAANGTSKHGIRATGGTAGTSDGISAIAGTGGVPIRGDITGNITGNLSGSAGSVSGAVGSIASGGINEASFATTAGSFIPLGIIDQGTAQAATSTTLQIRAAAAFGDNAAISQAAVFGSDQGYWQLVGVVSNVGATDTLTLSAPYAVTPTGTITYKLFGVAALPTALPAVNVTQWLGTAVSTPTVAGVPNVNAKTWNDLTTVALPATPTNITAGTITTVTNLTNAPTSGDLTATMKTSVQTAADAAVTANASIAAIKVYPDRTVGRGTVSATSPTTTSFTASAMSPSGAVADQFKGRILIFDNATTTAALRGQATDITANTSASLPVFTYTALTTAPASGDTFSIV